MRVDSKKFHLRKRVDAARPELSRKQRAQLIANDWRQRRPTLPKLKCLEKPFPDEGGGDGI